MWKRYQLHDSYVSFFVYSIQDKPVLYQSDTLLHLISVAATCLYNRNVSFKLCLCIGSIGKIYFYKKLCFHYNTWLLLYVTSKSTEFKLLAHLQMTCHVLCYRLFTPLVVARCSVTANGWTSRTPDTLTYKRNVPKVKCYVPTTP